MSLYEDATIRLDGAGITIKDFHRPGQLRQERYDTIAGAELIPLRVGTGRFRLIGISPGRPRHFFHWDPRRRSKSHAVSVDLGGWRRLAITPDDPERVLALILGQLRK